MSSFPVASDLAATWTFIQPGLEHILGSQGDQGVTANMYMNCYTAVYNYCVNKSRTGQSPAVGSSGDNSSYSLAGAEIYSKLDNYLTMFIRQLKQSPDESFLEFYVRKWTRFTIGAGYMDNVFNYMNRYWVQKERSDGRRDVFDVNTLCLIKWKLEMFQANAETLVDQVLELIEKQRNNEIVETNLISSAIKSFVALGIDVQDLKKNNLVVYIQNFEQKFLARTGEYYSKESASFLLEHNVVDYMKKCETRLAEEQSRSNNYLEYHTKKSLVDVLNKALIEDHTQEMYAQFLTLLEQNETEHINRMFKLLSRVPKTLAPLAETFETYIKDEAAKKLNDLKSTTEEAAKTGAKPKSAALDPKSYINTLMEIYYRFNAVVASAFSKDPLFIKALDQACRFFVNKNPIATPTPKSKCRTPELLAKYADGFLRGSAKESDTTDMNPDILMTVFKFITDKDAFEEYYRRLLAKRLINGNSKSAEEEEAIIKRLQEENSIEYTSKMTKMFSDMKASDDLKAEIPVSSAIKDFNPLVLAQSMWPFSFSEDYSLKMAPELQPSFDKVEEIYYNKHTGRQLRWLWNHGRAELKANLSRKGKPPFIFTVSNIQLMILMCFNHQSSYTMAQLWDRVGCSRAIFEAHLMPLTKYKLLDQSPANPEAFSDDATSFTIVDEYKSKKLRVNFISAIKNTEAKQEEDDAVKEIAETRKNHLASVIVRIMKGRKQLKHTDLINEVMTQSMSRFQASMIDIKRVIDSLIEKDYIARIDGGQAYEYRS
ncbi:cell division control protein 53 [Diutina catenulata]